MKARIIYLIILFFILPTSIEAQPIELAVAAELNLNEPIGQLRAVPLQIGNQKNICAMHSTDAEIDPYIGMFFFPKSTLKLTTFSEKGKVLWKKDLGPGVVPGIWFSPIFSFDLDQNGTDEIYLIGNKDPEHPMDYRQYVLQRLEAASGKVTGEWPWPKPIGTQSMSHTYRHFIFGGMAGDEPVLITAQGTYGVMALQGWNSDMSLRWEKKIDDEGPAGSHVSPVVDLDQDGNDEILWGERAISVNDGKELFCVDSWPGHSDIVQPVYDYQDKKWYIHTCRESHNDVSPRIVTFDASGRQVWGDLDQGHIDTGWSARLGEKREPVVLGVRVGAKVRTAEGEKRLDVEEFTYHAVSGKPVDLGFDVYTSIPVDLNGDGRHELVKGYFEGNGDVLSGKGKKLGNIGGFSAMASKFTSLPGEQILSYSKDGTVLIWYDKNAKDGKEAKERYANPFYRINQRQTGNGYNLFTLGGI